MAEKTVPRTKPVPSPRVAETPSVTPAHPADAPASQPTSGPVSAEAPIANDWRRELASWFAAHKTYPDEARRSGTEGNLVLRFTADRSGRVLDVVVVRSAGSALLDAAAIAMVRNATLPPFTAGMSQDRVTVTVQIHYALTE
jgi:protein TonB